MVMVIMVMVMVVSLFGKILLIVCFAATVLPQNLLSGKFAVCNTEGGIRKCRECGASSAPSAFSSSADMCNQHISLMQLEIDDEHAHDPSLHPLYAQSADDGVQRKVV